MKRWLLLTLGILLLSSVLTLREWLIKKEVESLQAELSNSLVQSLESAESFDRLHQISESGFVYERYLEPIFTSAHRMLWPNLRQSHISAWETKVHRELEDAKYLRLVQLREKIESQIQNLKAELTPSKERLQSVVELSLQLDSESARLTALHSEIDAIEDLIETMDNQLYAEVRGEGLERLKALKIKINKMDEAAFRKYISSSAFIAEVQRPVVHKVLEMSSAEVRKSMWDEYMKALSRILSRKTKQIAKAEKTEALAKKQVESEEKASVQSLAELIRREYESDEISYVPTPPSPSASN